MSNSTAVALVLAGTLALAVLAAGAPAGSGRQPQPQRLIEQQQHRSQHQQQHSTGATLQRSAESSETLTACFKYTKGVNCRSTSTFYIDRVVANYNYFETPLSCCTSARQAPPRQADPLPGLWTSGGSQCELTFVFTPDELKVDDKLQKIGSFFATCTLNNAEACIGPVAELGPKVEISAQGTIYRIFDAIITSNPGVIEADTACSINPPLPPFRAAGAGDKKTKPTKPSSSPAHAQFIVDRDDPVPATGSFWKVSYADVATGTMTVVAPKAAGRVTSGSLKFFAGYDSDENSANPPTAITAQEVGSQEVLSVAPYTAAFTFYQKKTAEY